MEIRFTPSESLSALEELLEQLSALSHVQGLMVLAAAGNPLPEDRLRSLFSRHALPLFGGVFPKIIAQGACHSQGFLVMGLRCSPRIKTVFGLSNRKPGKTDDLLGLPRIDGGPSTFFTLVDGHSGGIDGFLRDLFAAYGAGCNYLGGGAGHLDRVDLPCVFTNDGFFRDSAVLAQSDLISGLGVGHGMQPLEGTLQVTEAWQNRLQTLNWEPAFAVYREKLASYGMARKSDDDLLKATRDYALGLSRCAAGEMIVRDPFAVGPNGEIVCAGAIPRGSRVNLLKADPDNLLKAAQMARQQAEHNYAGEKPPVATLMFDCYSREEFLGTRFVEEVEAICGTNPPSAGALTIGEIANLEQHYIDLLNKTAVVAQVRCRYD